MYCGTSNIVLPVANKTLFPDAFRTASRLSYYAAIFNSVEINSTFYKLPMPKTTEKWANETPAGFRFSVKLWKQITHQKELVYTEKDIRLFFDTCEGFGDKKGCLLVQLPAGAKAIYADRFEDLLHAIALNNTGWKLAIEFRDPEWYTERTSNLLENYGCCLVEHDMPRSVTPKPLPAANTRYLRFHGTEGKYRGGYTDTFLAQTLPGILSSEKKGQTVYVYFNNTMGPAVFNAIELKNRYAEATNQ